MRTKAFWGVLLVATLLLGACGPMIGSMMVSGNGVKEFRVTSGTLATLRPGATLAVIGPFDKTGNGFYICRGEDEAYLASSLNQTGVFRAELAIPERFPKQLPKVADWQGRSGRDIQQALKLSSTPDYLLGGTILSREMIAAPTQGVIMKIALRLDFLEVATGKTTAVEVAVQELFQDAVPAIAKELGRQLGKR